MTIGFRTAVVTGVVALATAPLSAERLPTTVFTARDGIAPTVRRIVADSKGFLWFAGTEGLVRFDGNEFRVFTEADGLPVSILIIKEALTNVLRHAQATNVVVFVTASQGRLRIEVTDDGVGLDGNRRNGPAGPSGGHGLENMQRRASALGGTARIDSPAPGRGTHIVVDVPVTPPHVHAVGHIGSRR